MIVQKILVPTDFGSVAQMALRYARDLAHVFGASLDVVHVIGPVTWPVDVTRATGRPMPDEETAAHERMKRLVAAADGVDVTTRVLAGDPFQQIVKYAAEHRIDMIVMGTHGRGLVSHLFLGSLAERVVRHAPCGVLTVRQPQRDLLRDAGKAASVDSRRQHHA